MKKLILAAMICSALCCMGCDDTPAANSQNPQTTTTTEAAQTTAATTTAPAVITTTAPAEPVIGEADAPVGTFLDITYSENVYVFRADGSGSIRTIETGTGVPFQTEFDKATSTITFHIGGAEDTEKATLLRYSDSVINLKWEDGRELALDCVSDKEQEFYNYDQLGKLALDYYEALNGTRPESFAVQPAQTGQAAIQLMENHKDNVATLEWYFVNPFDCCGENLMGDFVNLLEKPDPAALSTPDTITTAPATTQAVE